MTPQGDSIYLALSRETGLEGDALGVMAVPRSRAIAIASRAEYWVATWDLDTSSGTDDVLAMKFWPCERKNGIRAVEIVSVGRCPDGMMWMEDVLERSAA